MPIYDVSRNLSKFVIIWLIGEDKSGPAYMPHNFTIKTRINVTSNK